MPAKDAGLSSFPFLIHISCFWSLCCQLNGRNHRKCCPVRASPLKQQVLPSSSPWLMNSDGERQEPKVTLVGACISHLCSLLGKGLGQLHTSFWLDWFCQAKKMSVLTLKSSAVVLDVTQLCHCIMQTRHRCSSAGLRESSWDDADRKEKPAWWCLLWQLLL